MRVRWFIAILMDASGQMHYLHITPFLLQMLNHQATMAMLSRRLTAQQYCWYGKEGRTQLLFDTTLSQ